MSLTAYLNEEDLNELRFIYKKNDIFIHLTPPCQLVHVSICTQMYSFLICVSYLVFHIFSEKQLLKDIYTPFHSISYI